ncbi:MAG TPA: hypothetical protein VG621_00930 [Candidatus Paceibacterota bacterium]|nr:hypothetical protein [Candidatus Paceibacterota bacterium]
MKRTLRQLVILIPLLFLAGGVAAYTSPTSAPTGNNTNEPIEVSAASQVKPAGLGVNAFLDQGDGWFQGQTFVNGIIRGGSAIDANPDSQVYVGTDDNKASLSLNNTLTNTGTVQSNSLVSTSGSTSEVCADASGTLVLCSGVVSQPTVTISASYGQTLFATGIAGFTQSAPTNTTYTGTHTAFTAPIQVQVTLGPSAPPQAGLVLEVNNVRRYCDVVTKTTTANFPSTAFRQDDSITIASVSSGC